MTLGVILAGGLSRRMGRSKSELPFGQTTMLEHVVARLAPQCDLVVVNANSEIRIANAVVNDPLPGALGPMAGLLAGMTYAQRHGFSKIVTVAVDTPFFPDTYVKSLQTGRNALIVLAKSESGSHPTCGLWDVSLRDDLAASLHAGERKVMAWARRHNAVSIHFSSTSFDPFFNVNTPSDYEQAQHIIAGQT